MGSKPMFGGTPVDGNVSQSKPMFGGTPVDRQEKLAQEMSHQESFSQGPPLDTSPLSVPATFQFGPYDSGVEMPMGLSRFVEGGGQAFTQTPRGIGELTGMISPEEMQESQRLDSELMQDPMGAFGSTMGHVAQMSVLPMGMPMRAAELMGAYGLAQPGDLWDRLISGASAAGGGYMGGKLGQMFGKPLKRSKLDKNEQKTVLDALDLGARGTPGQLTKNGKLLNKEKMMKSDPDMADWMAGVNEHNQGLLNTLATKTFGESSDTITPELLGNAANRVGDTIKSSLENQIVSLGKFKVAAHKALASAKDTPSGVGKSKVRRLTEWLNNRGNKISAEEYQVARSQLIKDADAAWRKGDQMGEVYSSLITLLDDAAAVSVPKANMEALKVARNQWRNLVEVEKSLGKDLTFVNASRLANNLRKSRKGAYLRGNEKFLTQAEKDLFKMTRFSNQYPKLVGESAHAMRQAGSLSEMKGLSRGAGAGGLAYLAGAEPMTAAAVGLGVLPFQMGAKKVNNMLYRSPSNLQRAIQGNNPATGAFGRTGGSSAIGLEELFGYLGGE